MSDNILTLENVAISNNGKCILKNINLSVVSGDFIFIKGVNGSGKSTLLNTLSRYQPSKCNYTITDGIMKYRDNDINLFTRIDKDNYRKNIYYIPQDPSSANVISVYDKLNGAVEFIINRKLSYDEIIVFLEDCEITKLFPKHSLGDLLKEKISRLSIGQQKMIELLSGFIRCQYNELLIIDEPFNNLDTQNIYHFVKLFDQLRRKYKKLAVIVTTHCQAFSVPDKFLLLKDKTIMNSSEAYVQGSCFSML